MEGVAPPLHTASSPWHTDMAAVRLDGRVAPLTSVRPLPQAAAATNQKKVKETVTQKSWEEQRDKKCNQKGHHRGSHCGSAETNKPHGLVSMGMRVRSLASRSGLRIQHCRELWCVGRRRSLDLAWLWLWCRLAAVVPIQLLACELPYALGAALKKQKHFFFKKGKENKGHVTPHFFSS